MKRLDEDQLIIKKKKIKAEPITENLEQLYGIDVMVTVPVPTGLVPTMPADPYIDEFFHNDRKYLVANDKFVTMSKGHFGNMISEIEKLKRIIREHDREMTRMKSRIESLANRRNGAQ